MHEEDEPDDGPVDGGDIWAAYHRTHNMGPVTWQLVLFWIASIGFSVGVLLLARYLGPARFGLAVMWVMFIAIPVLLVCMAVALYRESRR